MRKALFGDFRRLVVVVATVSACGCLSAVASADVTAAGNALASVPASQKMVGVRGGATVFHARQVAVSAAAAAATAHKLRTSVRAAARAASCWSWTPWEKGYNLAGGTVWEYNQGLYWCGNGSTITYRAASNNYPSSLGFGWSFSGNMGYWNQGGEGSSYWTHWNQGHFCLASYFGCVQNSYPWIQSTVYGNGYGTYSWG